MALLIHCCQLDFIPCPELAQRAHDGQMNTIQGDKNAKAKCPIFWKCFWLASNACFLKNYSQNGRGNSIFLIIQFELYEICKLKWLNIGSFIWFNLIFKKLFFLGWMSRKSNHKSRQFIDLCASCSRSIPKLNQWRSQLVSVFHDIIFLVI